MFIKQIFCCPYCDIKTENTICCNRCAENLKQFINNKTGQTPYCDEFTAPLIYDDMVREAVIRFKFEDRFDYHESFSMLMSNCTPFNGDVIISVPSYKKYRKYNTSILLAKDMSEHWNINYTSKAVRKIKETKFQHQCEFEQRLTNLNDSFIANPRKVSGKNIIICDDIITSGSTIDEVAKACKNAGAIKVYAIGLAVSKGAFT